MKWRSALKINTPTNIEWVGQKENSGYKTLSIMVNIKNGVINTKILRKKDQVICIDEIAYTGPVTITWKSEEIHNAV